MVAPGIKFGNGITLGYGIAIGAGSPAPPPVPGTDNATGYNEMPPPVTPGGDIEDKTATINGSTGFTINDPNNVFPNIGGTGVAITALTANNQAFFATYGTGTRTVSWGPGSTYSSSTVNVVTNSGSSLIFFINPALSYPATFNYPFTFN